MTGMVPRVMENGDGQGSFVVAGRRSDPGDHHPLVAVLPLSPAA
jgi:hypothetical protein